MRAVFFKEHAEINRIGVNRRVCVLDEDYLFAGGACKMGVGAHLIRCLLSVTLARVAAFSSLLFKMQRRANS